MSSSGVLPLQFPDAPDLQVWYNAAFDDEEPTRPKDLPAGWAHSSKENLSPVLDNSSAAPLKPQEGNAEEEEEEEGKITREIEEIEREIARLSSRLHALKLEKAERKTKRRGRIVQAKFMDATRRRGLSLGPAEIHSGSRLRLLKESGILTPASSSKQSRRVSCFWRIQEIDELNVIKERGKSASLSPKERKQTGPKPKQVGGTGVSKKPAKKDGGLIQPRMLFGDGERPEKKAVKPPRRVVASRYNSGQGEARKRSLPDTNNEEGNKRRVSRAQHQQPRRSDHESGRLKKRWDIAAPVEDILPKIRTLRQTPWDSGAAKRIADLVGRRPYFGDDRSGGAKAAGVDSVIQVLRFGEMEDC